LPTLIGWIVKVFMSVEFHISFLLGETEFY